MKELKILKKKSSMKKRNLFKLNVDLFFLVNPLVLCFISQVWILTGDKEETAVNISYSAGHFLEGMTELRITQLRSTSDCDICGSMIQQHLETIR